VPTETVEGVLPRHVAIIMDGNGRWARSRGLSRSDGHRAGLEATRNAVEYLGNRGIQALTLFAFSSENWSRPQPEVDALLELFLTAIETELPELVQQGIRLRFIGDRAAFPSDLQSRMGEAERACERNHGMQLAIALGYGGRWDILEAAQRCCDMRESTAEGFSVEAFTASLSTQGMPELDLLIRTGGERRLSNFLLWQAAYAELYFMDVFWPDVQDQDLAIAIDDFVSRQRRFGGSDPEG
jgi:undecaprenyl diphosphate synthase